MNLEKIREKILKYGLSFPDTYQDAPFRDKNWQLVRTGENNKAFLWTYEKDGYICINVKSDPQKALFWCEAFESVVPAYHQNKEHWNTVVLDGSVPDDTVKLMIEESYGLVAVSFARKVYEAVRKIPRGKVASYSQVAALVGDRKKARAVGNALHKNPDQSDIPCHRVVNAAGRLAGEFAFGGAGAQAKLLMAEGVEVANGKVDMGKYQWQEK